MVAHKYSYGIPKARKTSIPAEAHVCRSPPFFRHSWCIRQFRGRPMGKCWPTVGKNSGITTFLPSEPEFSVRMFNALAACLIDFIILYYPFSSYVYIAFIQFCPQNTRENTWIEEKNLIRENGVLIKFSTF